MVKGTLSILFFLIQVIAYAQLNGTIKDEAGKPIASATILVAGTYLGTAANDKGAFSFSSFPNGQQVLLIKSLGYKTQRISVTADHRASAIAVVLQKEIQAMEEVVINSGTNPANRIIKQAIKNKKINAAKNDKYFVDFYSRGLMRVKNLPSKIGFAKIPDEFGLLDSTRSGIVYLSETVSKIAFQKPDNLHEEIIASKVSGDDRGFSFNTAIGANFDFYADYINYGNKIISPLADASFSYYRFSLIQTTTEDKHQIHQIKVSPLRDKEPVVEGYIYIVDDSWEIYAVDFQLLGYRMGLPVVDKLHLTQQYNYNDKDKRWTKSLQTLELGLGLLGINLQGRYSQNFSNYSFVKKFDKGTFGPKLIEIKKDANSKDSVFWTQFRAIPLALEEQRDYYKKDSIQQLKNSTAYLDSTDRAFNRFRPQDILLGYSYRHSQRNFRFSYQGLSSLSRTSFNAVQGWNFTPGITASLGKANSGRLFSGAIDLNYGLSDKKLNPQGHFSYRFNSHNFATLRLDLGRKVSQINQEEAISPLLNMFSALIFKENFMKVYQKDFLRIHYEQYISSTLQLSTELAYARRTALWNHTNYSFFKKETAYAANNPRNENDYTHPGFENNDILTLGFMAKWKPGQKLIVRPDATIYLNRTAYPKLNVGYDYSIDLSANSKNFHKAFAQILQTVDFQNKGQLAVRLEAGKFFGAENISFLDYKHFKGNQTHVSVGDAPLTRFRLLPYYSLSTNNAYMELHGEHNFKGFIMNKIPLLSMLQWNLILGYQLLKVTDQKAYQEFSVGFDQIGFGKYRFLRLDYVRSYQQHTQQEGFVIGLNIPFPASN